MTNRDNHLFPNPQLAASINTSLSKSLSLSGISSTRLTISLLLLLHYHLEDRRLVDKVDEVLAVGPRLRILHPPPEEIHPSQEFLIAVLNSRGRRYIIGEGVGGE